MNSVAFSTNGRFAISGSDDGSTRLWNISDDTWTAFLSGSGKNAGKWLIYTHDGYWDGSNDCGDLVAMVRGLDCWNIDQFAVKNNRPDIILSRLPGSDQKLIAHYRALYEKRLRKLGLTEAALSSDYHVPEAKILDSKQEGKFVNLRFSLSDSRENLKFYNIYVNDVPLFGATGKPLSGKSSVLTERIELVAGTNKIELSCMNARGAESFRPAVYVDCDVKIKPNLYFIGFGVSKYQNRLAGKSVDLAYAAKDAEDLAGLYLRMQGNIYEKVFVKTFLDSEATKANLKSAKSFLDGARPEDTFVLFISGHGKYVGDTYYYITHETDFKNIPGTAADFELVEDLLQGIAPRQKLFLMDTCESGEREGEAQVALAEGGRGLRPRALPVEKGLRIMAPVEGFLLEKKDRYIYNDLARRSGSIVFSSSRGDERSLEADEYQNGLFTALLKRALAGNADKDKNKSVDVRELVDYVSAEVPGVAETLSKRENLNFTQHPTVDRDNIYIKFGFPVVR